MGVAETNLRNHLLDDLKKILLCSLPDLSRGHRGRRVSHEHSTQPLLQTRLVDHRLKAIGQVDDLFQVARVDLQQLSHVYSRRRHRPKKVLSIITLNGRATEAG